MLAIYYGDAWGAKSQPLMSTVFQTADGKRYPSSEGFPGGVLSESALAKYGIPRVTGTFAFGIFMANAAVRTPSSSYLAFTRHKLMMFQIGALIAHCISSGQGNCSCIQERKGRSI
jgi:hypothetical protein